MITITLYTTFPNLDIKRLNEVAASASEGDLPISLSDFTIVG